jgi:hypothetical protein
VLLIRSSETETLPVTDAVEQDQLSIRSVLYRSLLCIHNTECIAWTPESVQLVPAFHHRISMIFHRKFLRKVVRGGFNFGSYRLSVNPI